MKTIGTFLAVLILPCSLLAGSPEIVFFPGNTTRSIGLSALVLEDTTAGLAPGEAWLAEGYAASYSDVPNFQVSRAAHWLKFILRNDSDEPRLTLSIPYAEIDELDVWVMTENGPVQLARLGRSRVGQGDPVTGSNQEVVLPVAAGHTVGVLVRVAGFKPIHVPMYINSEGEASALKSKRNLFLGGYGGLMLVLALYNFFIFITTKDKGYLLYTFYIFCISSAQLTFLGLGPFDLLDVPGWLNGRASILFALMAVVFGMEFARKFIGTKRLTPKLEKVFPIFHLLIIIDVIIYLVGDPLIGYQFAQAITGWSAIFLLIVAGTSFRKGSRQAGFFLVAWTAFLLGVVVFVLKDAGVLPFTTFTQYAMPIGSAVEGILLSFGLADRINILRREKEQSQAQALQISKENEKIIREQNIVLEEKVRQRTHALQESNEHLKRTQTQLVNAEKMASLGQLTAGIAHEINNPINFITSNIHPLKRNIADIVEAINDYRNIDPAQAQQRLQELRRKAESMGLQESINELDEIIQSITEGSSRTAEIVRGLRNFSRLDESDLKETDLNEGIRSTITVLAPQYRDRIELELDLGELPKVECYPGKVNQVFMNILTNAIQATLARTTATTRTVRINSHATEEHVVIAVKDNGIGMNEDVKARIFDPFFTTKPVGEGTGLGMAIVYGIIQDHFGEIIVESTPGLGTEFKVVLPIRHQQLNERRA